MAKWVIPTSTDPFYVQTTSMDGVNFVLSFAFNGRESCWYLSLLTPDGTPLATGLKLVVSLFLLNGRAQEGLPPGDLLVYTPAADTSPPGLKELGAGARCQLIYLDAAEMASL